MPKQDVAAKGIQGRGQLDPPYCDGLRDLEGFSYLFLLYHFHLSSGHFVSVTPFLDDRPRGIFATRSPRRPNPIGLSTVRLVRVEGLTLHVEDGDVVDGTPLLDIKPYEPRFDDREDARIGWFEGKEELVRHVRADYRFRHA